MFKHSRSRVRYCHDDGHAAYTAGKQTDRGVCAEASLASPAPKNQATWHLALHLTETLIPAPSCLMVPKSSLYHLGVCHLGVCRVRRVHKKLPGDTRLWRVSYLLSHRAGPVMLWARAPWNQEMKELSVPDYCSPTVNCRRDCQIGGGHCETCISSSGKSACRPHVACVRL
jgi:hypothetical protein